MKKADVQGPVTGGPSLPLAGWLCCGLESAKLGYIMWCKTSGSLIWSSQLSVVTSGWFSVWPKCLK